MKNKDGKLILLICLIGLGINLAGAQLAIAGKLPLFLDCIGTLLTAALCGYIPGILVGFLTNLINGLNSYPTLYYGVLNVLLAVFSAWFAKRGYYKKLKGILICILAFTAVGGGLGSVLTWLLYGFGFGEGISAPLAHAIFDKGVLSVFWSQFIADVVIDLADKTVSTLAVALVLRLIPEHLKARFVLYGWRQKPLSLEKQNKIRRRASVRVSSLRAKIVAFLAAVILIIFAVVSGVSYFLFYHSMVDQQVNLAYGVANVAMSAIDEDQVDAYLEKGESVPGYLDTEKELKHVVDSTDDIEYVYVYKILPDGCHVVFDPDRADTPGSDPGTVIPFDDAFRPYLDRLLTGQPIDPIISNESYGWLLSVYAPAYDSEGVCQCYVGVDISMAQLMENGRAFMTKLISLFSGFFILILILALWLADYNIILPINSMANAARKFAYDTKEGRKSTLDRIKDLEISTGDELENLYTTLTMNAEETVRHMEATAEQADTINRLQNGLIYVLADLVESRDECTGNHIKNTAAYVSIIIDQLKKDGQFTEELTDEYVSDVINSAPLHDVGKIHVPDAILNKPGRLTEEEFTVMKEHTIAGSQILENAIDMVSESRSGYLKEAKNLAEFHHEKWNGTGYPWGLAGEEIPLSARIMAVADVFDALVSKRSYKDGFPFEKAMDIIREGAGTHFDPVVAQAFIESSDRVREIAEENNKKVSF